MILLTNRCKLRLCYPAFLRRSSTRWCSPHLLYNSQQAQHHDDHEDDQQHVDHCVQRHLSSPSSATAQRLDEPEYQYDQQDYDQYGYYQV